MERPFATRRAALLAECRLDAGTLAGLEERLQAFLDPFLASLSRREQMQHAREYCSGLLSDLERKNTESIAYRHDEDRKNLQNFMGQSCWQCGPLLDELTKQVGQSLGQSDGVLTLDPSAFPKKGNASVGVERQWCGRLGKIDNCQVGVYLGYVSGLGHALVDVRLYLPKAWAADTARRKKCHVPREVRYQTRTQLALALLDERAALLPHGWVTGDDEMGRAAWFRRALRERGERYLLAVPSPTTIRDLEAAPPAYAGFGGIRKNRFQRIDRWCAALPAEAWTQVEVRDGDKGPLRVAAVKVRVQARAEHSRVGPEEVAVVIRRTDEAGQTIHDYYLSNASFDTPLAEFARAAKAHHRIEECFQRGKSEVGLGDYELRSYGGWYHHQVLSFLAAWFLVEETRRGKKNYAGPDGPASPRRAVPPPPRRIELRPPQARRPRMPTPPRTNPTRTLIPLAQAQEVGTNEHR